MSQQEILSKIAKFVEQNNLKNAIVYAEDYELQSACSNNPGVPIYEAHILLYLLNDDLDNAKYLWKRTPKAYKNDEYKALWEVTKSLLKRDYALIYKSFSGRQWSESNSRYVKLLSDLFRDRTWRLVSTAYSNISAEKIAHLVGATKEEATKKCAEFGWKIEGELVFPKPLPLPKVQTVGIDQINQLTDYVVYLERKN